MIKQNDPWTYWGNAKPYIKPDLDPWHHEKKPYVKPETFFPGPKPKPFGPKPCPKPHHEPLPYPEHFKPKPEPHCPEPPFGPMPHPMPEPKPVCPKPVYPMPEPPIDDAKIFRKLSAIQADLYLLLNYIRELKLSDLVDVSKCLSPGFKDVLSFNGEKWDNTPLEPIFPLQIEVIPGQVEGDPVATIKVNGEVTELYSKRPDRVIVVPEHAAGDKVATIKVGERTYDLFASLPEAYTYRLLIECAECNPITVNAFGGQVSATMFAPEGRTFDTLNVTYTCSKDTAIVHADIQEDKITFTVDNLNDNIGIQINNPFTNQ